MRKVNAEQKQQSQRHPGKSVGSEVHGGLVVTKFEPTVGCHEMPRRVPEKSLETL